MRLFDADVIRHEAVSLSQGDMILIAVLRGGDYDNEVRCKHLSYADIDMT